MTTILTRPTETEQTIMVGQPANGLYRDRYAYDRDIIIEQAIRAWRLNPLARRLANLYKIYNVDGIQYKSDDPYTQAFLDKFWKNKLNKMKKKLEQISNEIFLTGNLFASHSMDKTGMGYYRIWPTDQIGEIVTEPNDLEQEMAYITRATSIDIEPRTFPGLLAVSMRAPVFMTHDTINQLAGTCWGEGEIWPDLPWLGRYASFLEDRVKINHWRQAFMYDVAISGNDTDKVKERKDEIRNNPPKTGDVNVHDESEKWSVINPTLASGEAEKDGLSLKKMVAVNHAPMHYLAEPESSTRTTADASGTPAFKAFENNQDTFIDIITDILTTAAARRAIVDKKMPKDPPIEVTAADATERDNAALALATGQIVSALGEMFDRELIESDEYKRLVYRFMGETLSADQVIKKGIRKPLTTPANANKGGIKTDIQTGDVTVPAEQ